MCQAFAQVLNGVFHERIEYPDVDLHPENKQVPPAIAAYVETSADERALREADAKKEQEQAQQEAGASVAQDAEANEAPAGKAEEDEAGN